MEHWLDEVATIFARPISRRRAFRLAASAIAGSTAAFLFPSRARAQKLMFCSDDFCDAVHYPGFSNCGIQNPGPDEFPLCCPANTVCCFNGGTNCECCTTGQDCCKTHAGHATGACCPTGSCCPNDQSGGATCCLNVCCVGTDGTTSGVCCDPLTQFCCLDDNGHARGCCPLGMTCCPDSAVQCCPHVAVDDCCGLVCCNAALPVCCEPLKGLCCALAGVTCCLAAFPAFTNCCQTGNCCHGPRLIPTACCAKPEDCHAGVCGELVLNFEGSGGGKSVDANFVTSTFRFDMVGVGALIDPNGVGSTTGISGLVEAFNYGTLTLITMTSFNGFQGMLGNGTIEIAASGTADVNGVSTPVIFDAQESSGVVTFNLLNSDTNEVLASGTGEEGRAAIALTVQ